MMGASKLGHFENVQFFCHAMSKVVYKASCWDCQDFYIGHFYIVKLQPVIL